MLDRQVHQLYPPLEGDEDGRIRLFSGYTAIANIVLLGDPGAGKTFLFENAAKAEKATYLTTRDFLNLPFPETGSTLFIDALDERRAGRRDSSTIDAVIQKLFVVAPSRVRISCRAADWLGETDSAAFRAYFDRHGGYTLLALKALLPEEQRSMLAGLGVADVETFLAAAKQRGVEQFLENPQTLSLLYEVVRTGDWPSTRSDLFDLATSVLLHEPNSAHATSGAGTFPAAELFEAAGALCAARLISDVAGISLQENSIDPDYPSYRTLSLADRERTLAALGRRAFRITSKANEVDYSHRTVAEYLAARWISGQVQRGLPLSRVRALLGIEGHPASELRGLHAWLATLLPSAANILISADPYGALTYGDAKSLEPNSRRHLLNELSNLSKTDPWFRGDSRESHSLAALATTDMIPAFNEILPDNGSGHALRSIVVDALVQGPPLPEMRGTLVLLLQDRKSAYGLRADATEALRRLGDDAESSIAKWYRLVSAADGVELRLKARVLADLYEKFFQPDDLLKLIGDALSCDDELVGGPFWRLPDAVPLLQIPDILDRYPLPSRGKRSKRRNLWEVMRVFDRLLLRYLMAFDTRIDTARVDDWLTARHDVDDYHGGDRNEELAAALKGIRGLPEALIARFLDAWPGSEAKWKLHFDFIRKVLGAVTAEEIFGEVIQRLTAGADGSKEQRNWYEFAITSVYGAGKGDPATFDALFALADRVTSLIDLRTSHTQCPWEPDRYRARTSREDASAKVRADNIRRFSDDRDKVRSGSHIGALTWAARIYFGVEEGTNEGAEPAARLVEYLGEENAAAALEGFIAVLNRSDLPDLAAVVRLLSQDQYYEWWYAPLAGIGEVWQKFEDLGRFDDELLRAMLAFDLTHPTFEPNDRSQKFYDWRRAAFSDRAGLVRNAFLAVVRARMSTGSPHMDGLYELLHDNAFAGFRDAIAMQLIQDFPNTEPLRLKDLLSVALKSPHHDQEIAAIARRNLDVWLGSTQCDLWVAAGYLAMPEELLPLLQQRAATRSAVVWSLRDLMGFNDRDEKGKRRKWGVSQLEDAARLTGHLYENTGPPSNGWAGDTNPWDAAEWVGQLINEVAALPSRDAGLALSRLSSDPKLFSYRDRLLHSLANQNRLRRDAEFQQPGWQSTIATLSNGSPAHVADLHALLVEQCRTLCQRLAVDNVDIYKQFWNENSRGRTSTPKPEESCRDVLVELLRKELRPLGVIVEPEGHMASDKRADITVALPGQKILVELKRDYHADVWNAIDGQLKSYVKDPEASGFGIYGVFWFGTKRPRAIPKVAAPEQPSTASEMETALRSRLTEDQAKKIAVVVFDISGEPAAPPGAPAKRQSARRRKAKSKGKVNSKRNANPKRKSGPSGHS